MPIRRVGSEAEPTPVRTLAPKRAATPAGMPAADSIASRAHPRVDALAVMASKAWGRAAVENVRSLGVNPVAVAATCVVENDCENTKPGTISGPFQMLDSTYDGDMRAIARERPDLRIDPSRAGKTAPANEALAAAQELKTAARALRSASHPYPTFLDVRGAYNFGPASGKSLQLASPRTSMREALPGYSAATLRSNGIGAAETVGEWRATVRARVGSAADEPVEVPASHRYVAGR